MKNSRLGALPCAKVKIPHVPPGYPEQPLRCAVVSWSSQYGKIVYVVIVAEGRQSLAEFALALTNWALPLDDTFTLVKDWS